MPRASTRKAKLRTAPGAEPTRLAWRPPSGLLFAVAALALALYCAFRTDRIADADSFGHLAQAAVYRTHGLRHHDFPWAAFSALRTTAADGWYGFHVLLVPFTFLHGPVAQIKGAGAAVMAGALLILWWAFRRLKVAHAWAWPLFAAFGAPLTLWRMSMTRPHVLTCALGPLLMAFLVYGTAWQVALIAAAISWLHLNFFWMTPLIVIVVAAVAYATRQPLPVAKPAAAFAGWVVGWALRPNPLGAAKLLYVQLVELWQVQHAHIPLMFGTELRRLGPRAFLFNYAAIFVPWLLAVIVVAWQRRRGKTLEPQTALALGSAFVLSLIFGLMMFVMASRVVDLWVPFDVMFAALVATVYWGPRARRKAAPRYALGALGVALLAALAINSLVSTAATFEQHGNPPTFLRGGSEWLRTHAAPGDIVVHLHWDIFPFLFYWNREQYYVGGLDPIFQYSYSHDLYWKLHHLATKEVVGATSGDQVFDRRHEESMHTVLVRDFHAKYLLLLPNRNRGMVDWCNIDARYEPVYQDEECAIFRVLPAGAK